MYIVCETQNLLTSQYTVYSQIPSNKKLYHMKTSRVIYNSMQINWIVLIEIQSLTQKGLGFFKVQ